MSYQYILEGKIPVPCEDAEKWAKWFKAAERHVALTKGPGVEVSTVFLGLDHGYESSVPMLFETMIFGGEHDGYQERYTSWDAAVAGHAEACKLAGVTP